LQPYPYIYVTVQFNWRACPIGDGPRYPFIEYCVSAQVLESECVRDIRHTILVSTATHTTRPNLVSLYMAIQLLYTASWPYSFFIQLLSYGHVQLLAVLCFIYGAGPTGPVVPFSPASALCLAWSRRTWRGRRGTRGAAERHAARRRRVVLIGNIEEACEPPQHRRVGAAPFLLLGGLVQPRH
jgi:hypothetical protein